MRHGIRSLTFLVYDADGI
ncbi:CRISPR-associated DxTHG motif protein [Vibrio coralliilyticus]|nr:CRISPR-associated DxTHG motif protein [Vibrio coralliilyticus]NOH61861.1 CRISPR-associated DxTHG motif protein [Vibrio sp. RE88]